MYDDVINKIAYDIILNDSFINVVFEYAKYYGTSFSVMLGILIGVRFLKIAFDL